MKRQDIQSTHPAQKVRQALKGLARFLGDLVLGAMYAVLVAIPWALRAGAVAVWAWGTLAAVQAVVTVFRTAPGQAEYALAGLPVLAFVAGGYLAWRIPRTRWGVLAATGLGLWFGTQALVWAWQIAPEAVALAPAVLWAAGSLYLGFRLRQYRESLKPNPNQGG